MSKGTPNIFHKITKKSTALFVAVFVCVGLLGISFVEIFAQPQISTQQLEVSPPSQEVQVDPGKTITIVAKVRNRSSETKPIRVRVEDFTAQGDEGQVALVQKGQWAISNWTSITPESFTLRPNEQKEVTARISVPQSGVGGGRYGSFVFSISGDKGKNAASISQEVASLFLVRINGPVEESLAMQGVVAPSFVEFGPVPLQMKFQNTGNVHVKTYGIVNVNNMFGQKTADIVVTGTNIFPGAARNITATLNNKLLIGTYTVNAIMYYGTTKNQTLTATTTFFALPVKLIAGLIIAFVLLFLIRKRLSKALKVLMG